MWITVAKSLQQLPEPPVNAMRVHPIDCQSILLLCHLVSVEFITGQLHTSEAISTKICKCDSATHLRTTCKLRNRPTEESKGTDSGSSSEDLIISDIEPGTFGPSGPFPSPEWMCDVHHELEHMSGLSLITESEPVHVSACPEIVPHTW